MSTQLENTKERVRGIVVNFALLTDNLLNNMRLDVGLNMSVDFLKYLQRHYRDTEKRDPSLDELYFLDRYLTLLGLLASRVGELYTDTTFIAETYADLCEKLNLIYREQTPPPLGSLACAARIYLERSGKKSPLDGLAATAAGDDSELRLLLSGYLPTVATDVGAAGSLALRKLLPPPGSVIAVLSPSEATEGGEFTRAVFSTISSGAGFICGELIGCTGLAGALPRLCTGAHIDISALPGVLPDNEMTELCDAAHGYVVVAIERLSINAFSAAARGEGLLLSVIGSVSSVSQLTVMHRGRSPVSLDMHFIKTLARQAGERFVLSPQSRLGTAKPAAGKISNFRVYDKISHLLISTVTADTSSDPFFMSLDAILTAVAGCVAGGAEFTDIVLSHSAKIPATDTGDATSSHIGGDALALILGAYRAQIEYCLPDTDSEYSCCGNEFSFAVSAAAKLVGRPVPARFTRPGNMVYLLSPLYGDDGLPDFEDLRRLWRYVAALCQDGIAASAFALTARGAADAIAALSSGSVGFSSELGIDSAITCRGAPGGIIIESSNRIEGILIGHTIAAADYMSI